MRNIAIFQSSIVADFRYPSGLETLQKYDAVVLQSEMEEALVDSSHRTYADGIPAAQWLRERGVEVWDYINPFWGKDASSYGGAGELYRKRQGLVAPWIRNGEGERVPVEGGKMWAIDIRDQGYINWLAENPPLGSRLFVDCGFYHAGGYHGGLDGSDQERAAAIKRLYGRWRSAGKVLMVNAGWESTNPRSDLRTYPFRDDVDGVAIEVPGGQGSSSGWFNVVKYKQGATPDLTNLRPIVQDWLRMGKAVWVVARWRRDKPKEYTYSPFTTFAEHAAFWRAACAEMGCDVAVYASPTRAEWSDSWGQPQTPPAEDEVKKLRQEVTDLQRRVTQLEKIAAFAYVS